LKNNPISGALYLFKGLQLIQKPGIRKFVIVPMIINILVFTAGFILMFGWVEGFIAQLMTELPDWLQWLSWLVWILVYAASLVLLYFTFTIIANFISAPFNGILAEAVEEHVTGKELVDNSPWHTAITQAPAAIREEFRKLFYSITRSLPFLLFFFIPGVNIIASALWMIFGAWMMAIQYADYPLGNHNIAFKDQRKKLSEKRLLVLGFGGAVMFGTMIPFVNFIILPCAVAGATAMYLDQFRISTDDAQDKLES